MYVFRAKIENHFSTRISVRVCALREMRKWKMKGKKKKNENSISFGIERSQRERSL